MTIGGTHTHSEVVVNKITKPELIQLLLNTEATLGSKNAKGKFRKLESFKGS